MRSLAFATAVLSLITSSLAELNHTEPITPSILLPSTFKPANNFKNVNLVHSINLEKAYPRETVNVIIENTSKEPQTDYFVPFTKQQFENLGGFVVKDKKNADVTGFEINPVKYDAESDTQYVRIKLPSPLEPAAQQTLVINYNFLSSVSPLPREIKQNEAQYLTYDFSAYWLSAYPSTKQKTELKFANADIKEYTEVAGKAAEKQGSKLTYGPYNDIEAGAYEPVRVRYEFSKPVLFVSRFERDVEVSHWGGNAAFEERYTLHNHAANLSSQFSRLEWASQQYYNPPTTALKEFKYPLKVGSLSAYFTDVVGNVSTSRFRTNKREAHLELKPRYPIFGGWNYPFRVGWDNDLKNFLRKTATGSFVLNVPFLEGPKQPEGIQYKDVEVRVILPEGAENVKYSTTFPVDTVTLTLHKTFLDTLGRTTLVFNAHNVVDDMRDQAIIVTYDYSLFAALRKPVTIFASIAGLFVAGWAIGMVDTSIKGKTA